MLNKNAELWCQELESGKHRQSRGSLQSLFGYCCLGVGAITYEKHTGNKLARDGDGVLIGGDLSTHQEVAEWLGLASPHGRAFEAPSLIALNDDLKKSFKEIASVIRSEPKGLFA